MRLRNLTLGIICAVGTLSGCAFGNRNAILNYPEPTQALPSTGVEICIEQLRDARQRLEVGEVRNLYYMRTAKVLTVSDVPDWATEALRKELKAQGYGVRIVPTATPHPSCPVVIQGAVTKAYVAMWLSFDGEVILELTAQQGGNQLFTERFTGTANGGDFAASGAGYADNLTRALQDAAQKLVHRVNVVFAPSSDAPVARYTPRTHTEAQVALE